jgi:hypothetical protein
MEADELIQYLSENTSLFSVDFSRAHGA